MRARGQCCVILGSLALLLLMPAGHAQANESVATDTPRDSAESRVSNHDAIEMRRQRIQILRNYCLRNPADMEAVLELADAYLRAGRRENAVEVLADAIDRLPPDSRLENSALVLAWAQRFAESATPDYPELVSRKHFLVLYELAGLARVDSGIRADALRIASRLHYLARRNDHDPLWWTDLVEPMQFVHADLDLRELWNHEPDDGRRHLLAARLDLKAVLESAPHNADALLFCAVLDLDFNRRLEAYTAFRGAFEHMTADSRDLFFSCELIRAPEDSLPAASLADSATCWMRFWNANTPDPGALISDAQLEFWRRVALARWYYGPPEQWLGDPGHPARVLIRAGEPDAVDIAPSWSQMDASENPDLARAGVAKETFTHRIETRGGLVLQYNQAGDSYRLQPASVARLDEYCGEAPVQLAALSDRQAAFFADHVSLPAGASESREHLTYALLPLDTDPGWWNGGKVRVDVYDSRSNVVHSVNERPVSDADIVAGPLGAIVLGAHEMPGLSPGGYSAHVELKTNRARASYDIPFEVASGDGRCAATELCVGALEFAYGYAPAERQPHFERSRWRYVPNPARLVDCGAAGDCGVNIVFDVWNAAIDPHRNSVLAIQIHIVPQEYLHYRESFARAEAAGMQPLRCSDLDSEFARRAACDPETGLQDERLLTSAMCLVFRAGEFEVDDLPQGWGRIAASEIVPLRPVDPSGRVLVPLRINVTSLEPGNYGLTVQVFDRLAERREGREVRAVSARAVWFQVVAGG